MLVVNKKGGMVIVISLVFTIYILFWCSNTIRAVFGGRLRKHQHERNSSIVLAPNKVYPPGVILNPTGGIGNQLFEFACTFSIAEQRKWPLYIRYNEETNSDRKFKPEQREFSLDQFNIPALNVLTGSKLVGNVNRYGDERFLHQNFPNAVKTGREFVELSEYCQSPAYFENYSELIKKILQPSDKIQQSFSRRLGQIQDVITSTESVAVHVRRGDFLIPRWLKDGHFVPIAYQRIAIRRIVSILKKRQQNNPHFFVFSDDIEFVREGLSDMQHTWNITFVSGTDSTSLQELYLMTKCKHIIFPNSTFSWWAAFLMKNKDKIVISTAFNHIFHTVGKYPVLHTKLYHPMEWIVIDVFAGEVL